jgi:hypothetical protein
MRRGRAAVRLHRGEINTERIEQEQLLPDATTDSSRKAI